MNIFKLMQAMRPYIQSGEMTYDLAIKYLKERGVQFDGLVKKALDNMFKKIKARDPVFDKNVTKMHFDDEGLPFDPKTLKTIEEKRKYVIHHPDEKIERAKKLGVENLFEERTLPFGKNKDLTKVNIAKEIKREKTLQSALGKETTAPFNPKAAAFYDDIVEESMALAKRTGKDARSLIEERIGYKFRGDESMKEIIDIVEEKFFKADGGRIDLYRGGSPGDTHNNPSRGGFDYESEAYGAPDTIASITKHGGGGGDSGGGGDRGGAINLNLSPVVTYTPSNQIEKVGLQGNLGKLMAAGVIDLEDAITTGNIDPTMAAALNLGNFNLSGIKSPDQEGIFAQGNIGPVNVGGSYQDLGDSGIAKNIGASGMLGNLGMGVNYDFESNPNLGLSYNNPDAGLKGGVTYNLGGKPEGIISFSKKFKKGGRVGFQQGGTYDSRASVSDFAKALWNVGGGDQAQLQKDLRRYTTNVVSNLQNQLNQSTRRNYPTYEQAVQARKEEKNIQDKISRARYESARGMKNPNFAIDYDRFQKAYDKGLTKKYGQMDWVQDYRPYKLQDEFYIDPDTGAKTKNIFTDFENMGAGSINRYEDLANQLSQNTYGYWNEMGNQLTDPTYVSVRDNLRDIIASDAGKQMITYKDSNRQPGFIPRTLASIAEGRLSELTAAQRNKLARENARRYDELMVQTQPGYVRNVEAYNRRHSGNWLNKALAPNQSMSDYLTQAGDVYGLTTDQLWNYRAPAYKEPEPYTYKKYVPGIMASSPLNKFQAERMGYNPMTGDFRGIEGTGIGERNEYGAPIPVAPPLSNEFTDPYEGLSGQEYAEKYGIPYEAGGRVGYANGGLNLTDQAQTIYDAWERAGHSQEDILAYLESRGMYNTPVEQQGIMTAPNIINQNLGGDGGDGGGNTITPYDPNVNLGPNKDVIDYEADAYGIGPTWRGQFARLRSGFSKIPTPFNIAKMAAQKARDWADQRRIKKEKAEAAAAEALQKQITDQANQTARDLVAGGASPDWGKTETRSSSGWRSSPFAKGGLATMFTRRR